MHGFKGFILILVVIATAYGCAPTIRQEGVLNLGLTPAAPTNQITDINSTIARQRAMIANDPNNSSFFAVLSYWLSMNGQYDEAMTAAKRAIELNPSGEAGFRYLARAYKGKKQYDDALKAYEKAIAIAPLSTTYHHLGILHWERNDYANAVRAFKKASELDAKNDIHLIYLAIAYYRTGEYDDAIGVIDKAIALKNYGTMGMSFKVEKIQDILNYRIFTVTEVEKGGPADKAGIVVGSSIGFSGLYKTMKQNFDVSLDQIKKDIEGKAPGTPVEVTMIKPGAFQFPHKKTVILERVKDPSLSLKLGIKANLLARVGNMDKALKYATESLGSEQSNKNSESWAKAALGSIHIHNGNYDEAIKLLSGVVKSSATARLLEAIAYAKKGNTQKAVDIYSSIPEEKLSPKNMPIWNDRIALLETLKPFVASKKESAGDLQAQGRHREALKELGYALKVADDKTSKEIFGLINRIMSMDPRLSELPEEARKYTLRGDVMTEEGKFENAAKEYRKAVQAAPYIARLYFNTAMIYGELKKYPLAIRYMKTYLNLAPEAPNVRAAKDQIYKWEFVMEQGE